MTIRIRPPQAISGRLRPYPGASDPVEAGAGVARLPQADLKEADGLCAAPASSSRQSMMSHTATQSLSAIDTISARLEGVGYISTPAISTAVYLAHHLRKPILVEGPAGVGKTELAQSLSRCLELPLLRMQCYEGLDETKALYEWKYGKQLLYTQVLRERIRDVMGDAPTLEEAYARLGGFQDLFFSRDFLAPRPVLQAMEQPGGSVLLIDEIDKADEAFEALLLEVLSDYQVTVPEIGPIPAVTPPLVLLTSNNTRELGDALRRRCLHLFIGFPDAGRERRIVRARAPDVPDRLLHQLVDFVHSLRSENIRKLPSIAETIDWARTLVLLHADELEPGLVRDTLNVLLKRQADTAEVSERIETLTRSAVAGGQPRQS